MKKLACIVLEVEDGENVQTFLRSLEEICVRSNVPSYNIKTFESNLTWREKLKTILNQLKVTPAEKGYMMITYLMESVEQNPAYKKHVYLKGMYAYVTEKTGDIYSQIERRLRTSMANIYKKNSPEYVNKILNIPDNYDMKPAYFIASLVNVIFNNN